MNPLSTLPQNQYVTLHGHHGERVIGMRMADGDFLAREDDRVGRVGADAVAGWSE